MGYQYGGYYGPAYPSPMQQLQGENYALREKHDLGVTNSTTAKYGLGGGLAGALVGSRFGLWGAAIGFGVGLVGGAIFGNEQNEVETTHHDAADNGIIDGSPRYGINNGYGYGGSPFGGGYGGGYPQYGYNQYAGGGHA